VVEDWLYSHFTIAYYHQFPSFGHTYRIYNHVGYYRFVLRWRCCDNKTGSGKLLFIGEIALYVVM